MCFHHYILHHLQLLLTSPSASRMMTIRIRDAAGPPHPLQVARRVLVAVDLGTLQRRSTHEADRPDQTEDKEEEPFFFFFQVIFIFFVHRRSSLIILSFFHSFIHSFIWGGVQKTVCVVYLQCYLKSSCRVEVL